MKLTLNDLVADVDDDTLDGLLDSWRWLVGEAATPVLATVVGDLFFVNEETGEVLLLDAAAGEASVVVEDANDFRGKLSDGAFVREHFFVELLGDLLSAGLNADAGQVLVHKQPLVLDGDDDLDNMHALDASVHFHLMGQIHEQVANTPDGEEVNITLAD